MNETEIKTRLGYILQNLIAEALARYGYTYVMDPQYDSTCEVPDFLIPDDQDPKYLVEVHQTEARNSFQMKTLRAFTAVVEGKSHYGNDLISVNVLFGDPDKELPPANVRAMCSFFDANIIPRQHLKELADVTALEVAALAAASTDGKTVAASSKEIIADYSDEIDSLAKIVNLALKSASARADMTPLWGMERKRTKALGKSPLPGVNTYYKRMMLRSLYLRDKDFGELVRLKDPVACSASTLRQLIATNLVEVQEDIGGDSYELEPSFENFINDPDAPRLRALCKARLDSVPAMRWFFEDIRDSARRYKMAEEFLEIIKDPDGLTNAIKGNLVAEKYRGIPHPQRNWIADCAARYLGVSHNRVNASLRDLGCDPQKLGNPFNQLSYKSDRFMGQSSTHSVYAKGVQDSFDLIKNGPDAELAIDAKDLSGRLLALRLDGAIKLRKLDPLFLVADEICKRLGLVQEQVLVRSIVGDLAGTAAAGNYRAWKIVGPTKSAIMMNAVAVHDNHGDDKSKEWGARRLATIYRMKKGKFGFGGYDDALFILDGEWAQKDVQRLYRDGWNHICRLGDLEDKLKEIFEL